MGLPVDSGFALAEFVVNPLEIGRFKTPTLRNVNKSAPYMHNGVFATLEDVLEFYNKRDVDPKFVPEYPATMNTEDLGNLNLTDSEISDIIAFLKTLDDGYRQ
jgi:cytochrome c peroxidase